MLKYFYGAQSVPGTVSESDDISLLFRVQPRLFSPLKDLSCKPCYPANKQVCAAIETPLYKDKCLAIISITAKSHQGWISQHFSTFSNSDDSGFFKIPFFPPHLFLFTTCVACRKVPFIISCNSFSPSRTAENNTSMRHSCSAPRALQHHRSEMQPQHTQHAAAWFIALPPNIPGCLLTMRANTFHLSCQELSSWINQGRH